MGRPSSKELLLDAAERVIKRQGMASTTLEAVAAEAGLSKGGLFYHFSSKKDLLIQLLQRFERDFIAMRQKIYDSLPDTPSRLLKATVFTCTRHSEKCSVDFSNIMTLLDDVELREMVSNIKRRLFQEILESFPYPQKTALALLVLDGLWVMDLFAGESIPKELEHEIIDELLEMIDTHTSSRTESAPTFVARIAKSTV